MTSPRTPHRPTRAASLVLALVACATDVNLGRLSTGETTDTVTGEPAAICGDGVVQGEEECDSLGEDADGCLSTCLLATSCRQILGDAPDAADGVYTIDPDGADLNAPFSVYCDMTSSGGGWTLLGKIHRWHAEPNYDEPPDWLADQHDLPALLDVVSYEDRQAASASHGQARIAPMLVSVELARFTLIAEDDPMQRVSWFKAVDPGFWAWFTASEHAPTLVCSDVEMTQDCSTGRIRSDGIITLLEGMLLIHHGYAIYNNDLPIHVRFNGDSPYFLSGVCSSTDNYNSNAWHDDAIDGHWGNGLEIWLR